MNEYFVVVTEPQYKEEIHQELLAAHGTDPIPNRPVTCQDDMPFSEYNGIFLLTDAEAEQLRTDPRVSDVHQPPEALGIIRRPNGTRTGQYDKDPSSMTNVMKNWGIGRCVSLTNNFGSATSTSTYTYNLTGAGVDIIVIDTGVEPGHPEFTVNADGTGGSRVVDYDWTQLGAITSVPTGGFLGDNEGHGSNCASIAAGNTQGWASGAAIYSLRILDSTTNRDITDNRVLASVDELQAWQSIRLFHLAKPITLTGYRRPTIVTASYGYLAPYVAMTSITYRGVTHATNTTTGYAALYGTIGTAENSAGGSHGYRYSALDAEVTSVIAAGVIVVGSAGNDAHKIDVSTGSDYNNYWTGSIYGSVYYHRGASPGCASGVITVGAISYSIPEHKISFSCTGPKVAVFAPGSVITGAWSSVASALPSVQDPRNSSYWLNKLSGTSMACPQVTGVSALLLELRPQYTATDVLNFIKGSSAKGLLSETFYGQVGTYTNFASLQGAGNNYLYMPFNLPNPLTIT